MCGLCEAIARPVPERRAREERVWSELRVARVAVSPPSCANRATAKTCCAPHDSTIPHAHSVLSKVRNKLGRSRQGRWEKLAAARQPAGIRVQNTCRGSLRTARVWRHTPLSFCGVSRIQEGGRARGGCASTRCEGRGDYGCARYLLRARCMLATESWQIRRSNRLVSQGALGALGVQSVGSHPGPGS